MASRQAFLIDLARQGDEEAKADLFKEFPTAYRNEFGTIEIGNKAGGRVKAYKKGGLARKKRSIARGCGAVMGGRRKKTLYIQEIIMANLKMVQVGTNVHDEPVYNVMDENDKLVKTTIFTEAEALTMISGVEESAPVEEAEEIIEEVEAVIEEVEELEEVATPEPENSREVPNHSYKNMTKTQLEAFMRGHGVELDRRKSKSDLLEQVDGYFKGYFNIQELRNGHR